MKDRVSTQVLENGAIRYAEYDSNGVFSAYRWIKPDDEPSEYGTPLNKANLLSDETANALGYSSGNPTPNDILKNISGMVQDGENNILMLNNVCDPLYINTSHLGSEINFKRWGITNIGVSSQNMPNIANFKAIREPVVIYSTREMLVIMKEISPIAGRIWVNKYNSGWEGWKLLSSPRATLHSGLSIPSGGTSTITPVVLNGAGLEYYSEIIVNGVTCDVFKNTSGGVTNWYAYGSTPSYSFGGGTYSTTNIALKGTISGGAITITQCQCYYMTDGQGTPSSTFSVGSIEGIS